MHFLDLKTMVALNALTAAVSTVVIIQLWVQTRRRYHGVSFLVADFAMQTIGLFLIVMRGIIPEWLSVIPSNMLVIAGAIAGYIGLERYFGKRGPQLQNLVLLLLFSGVQFYFFQIDPNLTARNINISTALFIICAQTLLLLYRVPAVYRPATRLVAMVYAVYVIISFLRVVSQVIIHPEGNDYFRSGGFEIILFLFYNMLLALLAYGLILMVNKRLLSDVLSEEGEFFSAFHSSPYAIMLTSIPDGMIIEANSGFERISGYTAAQVLGRTTSELNIWANAEERAAAIDTLIKTGNVQDVEFTFRTKTGALITALYSASLIVMDGRQVVLSTINDITERKRAEHELQQYRDHLEELVRERTCSLEKVNLQFQREIEERTHVEFMLRASEEKYRGLYNSISDGIVMVDMQGKIIECNQSYCDMLGYTCEELARTTYRDLTPERWHDMEAQIVAAQILPRGYSDDYEKEYRKKNGTSFPVELKIWLIRETNGTPRGMWARVRDITERKAAETALRNMNEELERRVAERTAELAAKNKEMEQLIYVTSHDLRSPLVNVQGFTKELAYALRAITTAVDDTRIPDELRKQITGLIEKDVRESQYYIDAGVHKMEALLSGLLKLSRLGRMEFKQEPVDMNALLDEVTASFEYQLQSVKAVYHVSPLPSCSGDRAQIDQLFSNLIGNAVKYLDPARPGVITIAGRVENNMAVYSVTDNGIGVAREHQERIFEIFHRLNPSDTEGEGIGLAIVRRIVDRSRGRMWMESEPGKGSSFYVALPLSEERTQ